MSRPIRPEVAAAREAEVGVDRASLVPYEAAPVPVEAPEPAAPVHEARVDVDGPTEALTGPDAAWWERAVIGAVLQGYEDVGGLARVVGPAEFFETMHAAIWAAILGLWDDGIKPTAMMVMDRMGAAAHRLPQGAFYLSNLAGTMDLDAGQAPVYAEHVRECALKRQIGALGVRAQQIVSDPDSTSEQFLAGLDRWLDMLAKANARQHAHTGLTAALEAVINTAEVGQTTAVSSPWPDLDELTGGAHPGQLIVLAARPGVGKTIFAENWATHVARLPGHRSLFISLEMSEVEIVTRTLAWTAAVPLNALRAGGDAVTERHWNQIAAAQPVITGTRMTIVDTADQTVRDIRSRARQVAMDARRTGERLSMVVVDYVLLLTGTNPRHDARQVVNEASRELKKLARELSCTVILVAQLNRDGKDRKNPKPVMTDLKESGSLEQDADVVMLLHEVTEENDRGQMVPVDGEVEVLVPKHRNGPTFVRSLRKWGHYQVFRPMDWRPGQQVPGRAIAS